MTSLNIRQVIPAALLLMVLLLSACRSAYYDTLEKVGIHKRDILIDRVEETQESQEEAQEQFVSALEQFRSVVEFDGGELEDRFDKLNDEFEKSEAVADEVRDRIDDIEQVAGDLFDEWNQELSQYSNQTLRRESERSLKTTQQRYQKLIVTMRASEQRLDPVLDAMRDQVLYLKHNLNARALSAIRGEVASIDRDVDALVAAMQQSIAEAEEFIGGMRSESG